MQYLLRKERSGLSACCCHGCCLCHRHRWRQTPQWKNLVFFFCFTVSNIFCFIEIHLLFGHLFFRQKISFCICGCFSTFESQLEKYLFKKMPVSVQDGDILFEKKPQMWDSVFKIGVELVVIFMGLWLACNFQTRDLAPKTKVLRCSEHNAMHHAGGGMFMEGGWNVPWGWAHPWWVLTLVLG